MAPNQGAVKRKAAALGTGNDSGTMTPAAAFHQAFYTDGETSDDERTTRGKLKKQRGRRPKRPRVAPLKAESASDAESEDEGAEKGIALDRNAFVKLLFQLDGPQLNVNLADIFANSKVNVSEVLRASGLKLVRTDGRALKASGKHRGFLSLPVEIANMIYRELFIFGDGLIMFRGPENYAPPQALAKSSQILRTCRQIYEAGTAILYGENAFHFARVHEKRGKYFEDVWKEIGYKDARKWFHRIGRENMAKLKYLSFEFEDALPSNMKERVSLNRIITHKLRYVDDAVLVEILNMLAKHTELEKLKIGFRGCSNISEKDYHIMHALCSMRCYHFSKEPETGYSHIDTRMYLKIKGLVELPPRDNLDPKQKKFVPRMFGGPRRR